MSGKRSTDKGLAAKLWASAQGTLNFLEANKQSVSKTEQTVQDVDKNEEENESNIELKIDSVFTMPLEAYLTQEQETKFEVGNKSEECAESREKDSTNMKTIYSNVHFKLIDSKQVMLNSNTSTALKAFVERRIRGQESKNFESPKEQKQHSVHDQRFNNYKSAKPTKDDKTKQVKQTTGSLKQHEQHLGLERQHDDRKYLKPASNSFKPTKDDQTKQVKQTTESLKQHEQHLGLERQHDDRKYLKPANNSFKPTKDDKTKQVKQTTESLKQHEKHSCPERQNDDHKFLKPAKVDQTAKVKQLADTSKEHDQRSVLAPRNSDIKSSETGKDSKTIAKLTVCKSVDANSTEKALRNCKPCSVVLEGIDEYLMGRNRVFYRQWKRRFFKCGKACRIKHVTAKAKQPQAKEEKRGRKRRVKTVTEIPHEDTIHVPVDIHESKISRAESKIIPGKAKHDNFRKNMQQKTLSKTDLLRYRFIRKQQQNIGPSREKNCQNGMSSHAPGSCRADKLSDGDDVKSTNQNSNSIDKKTDPQTIAITSIKKEPGLSEHEGSTSTTTKARISATDTGREGNVGTVMKEIKKEKIDPAYDVHDKRTVKSNPATTVSKLYTKIPISKDTERKRHTTEPKHHVTAVTSKQQGTSSKHSPMVSKQNADIGKPMDQSNTNPDTVTAQPSSYNILKQFLKSSDRSLLNKSTVLSADGKSKDAKIDPKNAPTMIKHINQTSVEKTLPGQLLTSNTTSSSKRMLLLSINGQQFLTEAPDAVDPNKTVKSSTIVTPTVNAPGTNTPMFTLNNNQQILQNTVVKQPLQNSTPVGLSQALPTNATPQQPVQLQYVSNIVQPNKDTQVESQNTTTGYMLPTGHIIINPTNETKSALPIQMNTLPRAGFTVNAGGQNYYIPNVNTPRAGFGNIPSVVASPQVVCQSEPRIQFIQQPQTVHVPIAPAPPPMQYILTQNTPGASQKQIVMPQQKTIMIGNQPYMLVPTVNNQLQNSNATVANPPATIQQPTNNSSSIENSVKQKVDSNRVSSNESISVQSAFSSNMMKKIQHSDVSSTNPPKETPNLVKSVLARKTAMQNNSIIKAPTTVSVVEKLNRVMKRKAATPDVEVITIDDNPVTSLKKHRRKSKPQPREDYDDQSIMRGFTPSPNFIEIDHEPDSLVIDEDQGSCLVPKNPVLPRGIGSWPEGATVEEKKITLPSHMLRELEVRPMSEWPSVGQIVPNTKK